MMTRAKAVPVYPGFPEKLGRDSSSLEQPDLRHISHILSVSGGLDGKESACNMGDPGYIPGSGRSPGEGECQPTQVLLLENSMGRGAWWATVGRATELDMSEQLSLTPVGEIICNELPLSPYCFNSHVA